MNRIRELRLKKGWRQEDLAVKMNTKQQTIARYETEQLGIDATIINRLCDVFGVTSDYLLCRSDVAQAVLTAEDAEILALYYAAPHAIRQSVKTILAQSAPQAKSEAL